MNFNTVPFLSLFGLVVPVFFLTPHRYRWLFLLIASYCFYAHWRTPYLLLLAFSTVVDWGAALLIARTKDLRWRKLLLLVSLSGNLGLLVLFKYSAFLARGVGDLARLFGFPLALPHFELALPPGISFYTFQTMSYVIDVYRGELEAQRHLGKFALFVSFFPHLVAGPILRASLLMPQFDEVKTADTTRILEGLKLMVWGMFKKVVIGDRLAFYVTHVYGSPRSYDGLHALVATYFFAFQIYCDFSGYSDIAIGCARVLGFQLPENFRRPYFSKDVIEFWRRWHISLSTWFRDYVYVPLGGSRGSDAQTYGNLLITMYLAGLWHGASWTFVLWGLYSGAVLCITRYWYTRVGPRPGADGVAVRAARILITFHLVCLGWVFFRSTTIQHAWITLARIFTFPFLGEIRFDQVAQPIGGRNFTIDLVLIGLLLVVDLLERWEPLQDWLGRRSFATRLVVYLALIYGIILLGPGGNIPFIYFQF